MMGNVPKNACHCEGGLPPVAISRHKAAID